MSGWTDPTEFLSTIGSAGPAESTDRYSEFVSYDGADLDIRFLLSLKHSNHKLSRMVSVPDVYLCIDRVANDTHFSYRKKQCDPRTRSRRLATIRSGLLMVGRGARRRLWLPGEFHSLIMKSRTRFVVFNFGISEVSLSQGHSNAFLVDKKEKRVVRFDPSGKCCDDVVRAVMHEHLPGWGVEQHTHRAPIQTKETDSFRGMCVTFSLLYILLTILNPDRRPSEVHRRLQTRPPPVLKNWVLQLNRHIADTLRRYPKGSLTRGKPRNDSLLFPLQMSLLRHSRRRSRRSRRSSHKGIVRNVVFAPVSLRIPL